MSVCVSQQATLDHRLQSLLIPSRLGDDEDAVIATVVEKPLVSVTCCTGEALGFVVVLLSKPLYVKPHWRAVGLLMWAVSSLVLLFYQLLNIWTDNTG